VQNLLILNTIPILLNKLYIPLVRNSKPSLIKNPEAKEFKKIVKYATIKQKTKKLKGNLSFEMDILIKSRKNYDIDAPLKLLFDSLQGIAYTDDKQIVEIIVRKHLNAEKDGLNILIKEIE
jgi:Holliday junction resolvase RusA-like endonuclease